MQKWRLAALFLGVAVVLIATNAVLYSNFDNVRNAQSWTTHSLEVLQELNQLEINVNEVESSARGFMLTHTESLLGEINASEKSVWAHYGKALNKTGDNLDQQRALKELGDLLTARFKLTAENIELARKSPRVGLTGLQNNYLEESRQASDKLHGQIDVVTRAEDDLSRSRMEITAQSVWLVKVFFLVTVIVNLLLTYVAYWLIRGQLAAQNRQLEEQAHLNWVRGGLSELAELLAGQLSPHEVADKALSFLSRIFSVPAGNLFLAREKGLERFATLGGAPADRARTRYGFGESLVGAAFLQEPVHEVTNLPADYFPVTSSLGESLPNGLIFMPLRFEKAALGVIELATFNPLTQRMLDLLTPAQERIAVILNSALARERQQELLEETQSQAEELQSQQEELRSSNEELSQQALALQTAQERSQSQQEELRQINEELEAQARTLERQQESLNERNIELERANQYKSEFLAKMSHELRTPLNSMLILSSLLSENKEKNMSGEQREFASTIYNAGSDLLNLINDILDLSKLEARKLTLMPETFSVPGLCQQIEKQFRPMMQSKGLTFEIAIDPHAPTNLTTDRHRIEQILRNFISNAAKFTETGGVKLIYGLGVGTGEVKFIVQDTGIGIPADKRKKIFDAFEQADGSTSRKYGGTGLGLTISRELAILLQGRIDLESEEGKGSSFSLIIPGDVDGAAPQPTPVVAVESLSSEKEIAKVLSGLPEKSGERSVLIVEDDPSFRKAIEEAARVHGFKPIGVADNEECFAVLKKHTPTAILLDIKLPGMSGFGILETIKRNPDWRHIPVHMVSAVEYKMNALRMGAVGFLSKPTSLEGIKSAFDKIEGVLEKDLKRILVIEDDEAQQKAIVQLLKGPGTEIRSARLGGDALEMISECAYDCIIVDLSLPDIGGLNLLEAIHERLGESVPPIVVYTGRDLSRDEEDRLRAFSESIIIKGAKSPERLLDEVNLFLHRVESELPDEQRAILSELRLREKSFEGRTVLLVDDDVRNIFAMTSALESKGLKVIAARNGLEAIEKIQKHPSIDLALMDIMMPKMDGFEAIREIRKIEKFKDLPIIALTAKAMRGDHEKCIAAGANDYLPKPVNLMNLISVMRVWLSGKSLA